MTWCWLVPSLCLQDYNAALAILRSIPREGPLYIRSKMLCADIYLKYRKDKKLYASCFQELATASNDAHSYVMLAEAFIRIQEPEKAIKSYERAVQLDPKGKQ